jgi:hypothetical protein
VIRQASKTPIHKGRFAEDRRVGGNDDRQAKAGAVDIGSQERKPSPFRDGFIKALRDAHRWLDELPVDPTQTIESLAIREDKSERSIRMTLSLAFMSPALAEAAMEGRLPRGFCVKRLTDLPMLWSEQWRALGLQAPIQLQAEPS